MEKSEILKACKSEVEGRIKHTQDAIDSARESANSEQKSTAGDKHDTARAMAQFEQEKLSKQLSEQLKLKEMVSRISDSTSYDTVGIGSLVGCSNGVFFIGVGLGKMEVGTESVFCVSAVSPIGKALMGKKEKESFSVNGITFEVKIVS